MKTASKKLLNAIEGWVTIDGNHVFLPDGEEGKLDNMPRVTTKELADALPFSSARAYAKYRADNASSERGSISLTDAAKIRRAITRMKLTASDLEKGDDYLWHLGVGRGIRLGMPQPLRDNYLDAAHILYRWWPENTSTVSHTEAYQILRRFGFDNPDVMFAKIEEQRLGTWARVADLNQVSLQDKYKGKNITFKRESVQEASPPDLIGSVYNILAVTDDDKRARVESLFTASRAVYDGTLTDCIAEVGCSGRGRLMGGPELTKLKERAIWAAETIGNTYNKELLKMLEGARAQWIADHGSASGMTRLWLAKQAREWIEQRAAWKEAQIILTEAGVATDKARLDFWARNKIDGQVRVRPAGAVCKFCKRYVRKQWVSMAYAQKNFILPRHPNCPHVLQIRPDKETVPPCNELWRGQVLTGRKATEGLAEVARALEGGEGSGHFGHAGRSGEVGGSLPSGSVAIGSAPSLTLDKRLKPEMQEMVQATIREIGGVHNVEGMPPIRIAGLSGRYEGLFSPGKLAGEKGPPLIQINITNDADVAATNVIHEYGHYLDMVLGRDGNYSSGGASVMSAGVLSAIKASAPYLAMSEASTGKFAFVGRSFRGYLMEPKELMARAYTQYIVQKSTSRQLRDGFEKLVEGHSSYRAYWEPDQFRPIAEAFDGMFSQLRWLRK